jgi:peroxiredoxin Q/BCP
VIAPGAKLDLNFALNIWRNGVAEKARFSDLLTGRTIVSVYMKNNTPGCDRQNDSLAAHTRDFERAGYTLIALSRNTCGAHGRYAAARKLDYILASDPEDRFAQAADAMVQKSMYGRTFVGPARSAFVLERDGTVLAVIDRVDPARHGEQIAAAIKGL